MSYKYRWIKLVWITLFCRAQSTFHPPLRVKRERIVGQSIIISATVVSFKHFLFNCFKTQGGLFTPNYFYRGGYLNLEINNSSVEQERHADCSAASCDSQGCPVQCSWRRMWQANKHSVSSYHWSRKSSQTLSSWFSWGTLSSDGASLSWGSFGTWISLRQMKIKHKSVIHLV